MTTSDLDVAPRSRLAVMARRGVIRGLLAAAPVAAAAPFASARLTKGVLAVAVGVGVVSAIASVLELGADPDEPRLHERSLGTWLLGGLLLAAAVFQAHVLRRPRILSYEAHRVLEYVLASLFSGAVLATPWALLTGWRIARRSAAHAAARGATAPATREWRATLLLYTVGTGGAVLLVFPAVGLLALLWLAADWVDRRLVPRDAARFDPEPAAPAEAPASSPPSGPTAVQAAVVDAPPPSGTASTAPDVAGA